MSEIRDKTRKEIRQIVGEISALAVREYIGEADNYIAEFEAFIEQILSIPELAIVDRNAELPKLPFCCGDCRTTEVYAMNKMQEEGWVKEAKDER